MTAPRVCELCDGTGYQPGPPRTGQATGQPVTYTTVTNCRCTRGRNSWNAGTPPQPEQGELL